MALSEEITISYGGYTVGGSTGRRIASRIRIEKGYESTVVEYSFLIQHDTAGGFAAACIAAEAAYRTPQRSLRIANDGKTVLSLSELENAFDAEPSLTKGDDPADTGRSRIYHARVTFGMPADTGEEEAQGLRDSQVEMNFSPSRRATVTISGTFTAYKGTTSRDQYDAKESAFVSAVLSSLGGSYEKISERSEHNTHNTIVEWAQVWRELIFNQGAEGTLDDAAIVEQHLTISRRRDNQAGFTPYAEGGYGGVDVDPMVILTATYEAAIDKTSTTDLPAKYAAIRPWILDEINRVASAGGGGGKWGLVFEEPSYDHDENRISARLIVHAVGETDVLENRIDITDEVEVGLRLIPVWTGNPLEKYAYSGPATFRRTVSQTLLRTGTHSVYVAAIAGYSTAVGYRSGPADLSPLSGSGLVLEVINRSTSVTPKKLGLSGDSIEVTEVRATTVFEGFKPFAGSEYTSGAGNIAPPPATEGSGGSGPATVPPNVPGKG